MDEKELIRLALEVRKNSYSPYSGFAVGAALLCADGSVFCGANVENAAYGSSNCAERSALFAAVSAGKREFTMLAVAGGPSGGDVPDYCYPCGVCRQALSEFCREDFVILAARTETDCERVTLADLLPRAFGPGMLG